MYTCPTVYLSQLHKNLGDHPHLTHCTAGQEATICANVDRYLSRHIASLGGYEFKFYPKEQKHVLITSEHMPW